MTCTVTIDQTQVLYAVHEYLEKIGQSGMSQQGTLRV